MLHINLSPRHRADPGDDLGREWAGYDDAMAPEEVFEAARGTWKVGPRADRERFVLASAGRVIRVAAYITGWQQYRDRWAMEGVVLGSGHPVHDRFVGGPSPLGRSYGAPLRYFTDELDTAAGPDGVARRENDPRRPRDLGPDLELLRLVEQTLQTPSVSEPLAHRIARERDQPEADVVIGTDRLRSLGLLHGIPLAGRDRWHITDLTPADRDASRRERRGV